MADIIGSYERLPNDAVRAVAVAKRRVPMRDVEGGEKGERGRERGREGNREGG